MKSKKVKVIHKPICYKAVPIRGRKEGDTMKRKSAILEARAMGVLLRGNFPFQRKLPVVGPYRRNYQEEAEEKEFDRCIDWLAEAALVTVEPSSHHMTVIVSLTEAARKSRESCTTNTISEQ